jgi:hypothetical protein
MSIQYEPSSDPNWNHLRTVLAQSGPEAAPARPNLWRLKIAALTVVTMGLAVLVNVEIENAPQGAVSYTIEQFEDQVTRVEQQALASLRGRVVEAQPVKPTPKVIKPKKTSMLKPAADEQTTLVAGKHIRVEESVNELRNFQVETVDGSRLVGEKVTT